MRWPVILITPIGGVMRFLRPLFKIALIITITTWLGACGSGGGSDDPDPETSTDCVLGTSTIGNCKI